MDPLRCAGLMLKIKAMITDQRLLVAAFHAAALRHGGKVFHGFISVCTSRYAGRKVSVQRKVQRSKKLSNTHSKQTEQEGMSLYRQKLWVETIRHR